jgi:hypothetical protein
VRVVCFPDGGRYGYGFNYFCPECEVYLGNSFEDECLKHPSEVVNKKWFSKTSTPVKCSHAGETYAMPVHDVQVEVKT